MISDENRLYPRFQAACSSCLTIFSKQAMIACTFLAAPGENLSWRAVNARMTPIGEKQEI